MSLVVRNLDADGRARLPADPLSFLESLPGASAWRIPGRDRSRTRIVTTLLHGNEPSGFLALHSWLRSGATPAVDALCVIANVEAARLHPVFTNRSVPGRRDLNRCFLGPFDDVEGVLARQILEVAGTTGAEALIDIHNNTGHNPAYGVGMEPTEQALWLTRLFGQRFVWSQLQLGALLEAPLPCTAITLEVGKSGEAMADEVALRGIERFFALERLFEPPRAGAAVQVLLMPMRARIRDRHRLVMAQQPDPEAELTMPDDLDRHNFETIAAGTRIGWVRGDDCPLELIDEDGKDRAEEFFERRGSELVARAPFVPIMITVDAKIAASDCLFYVVREIIGETAREVD